MKNKIIDFVMFTVLLVMVALLLVTVALPQYQISSSVIGSGGSTISNANNILVSTVGEAFIGKSSNTVNQNQMGFWYVYQQSTITDVEDEETSPTVFKLEQNYPNPFNPSTKISYSLKTEGRVSLKIYNTLGEEVIKLVDEIKPAGIYEAGFNASELPSGIYIYRMQSGEYVSSKKMLLIK